MRSQYRGFTLIELICVVAIIGLIVGLAATQLDQFIPTYRLRAGAREVGALLKHARLEAASRGKDIYVQIDVSQGEYWMLVPFRKLNPDGSVKDPEEWEYQELFRRRLPSGGGKGVEFLDVILGAKQDKITSGRALLKMSPFGMSNHVIVNLRLEREVMAVKLNGLLGTLSFYDVYKEADELLEDQGL